MRELNVRSLEPRVADVKFSPDGTAIAYSAARDGDFRFVSEIFISPVARGIGRSLTGTLDRNVTQFQWMPDGRSVVIEANEGTSVGVWIQRSPRNSFSFSEPEISGRLRWDPRCRPEEPVGRGRGRSAWARTKAAHGAIPPILIGVLIRTSPAQPHADQNH